MRGKILRCGSKHERRHETANVLISTRRISRSAGAGRRPEVKRKDGLRQNGGILIKRNTKFCGVQTEPWVPSPFRLNDKKKRKP